VIDGKDEPGFCTVVGLHPGVSFVDAAQRIDGATAGQAIATDEAPESIGKRAGRWRAIEKAMRSDGGLGGDNIA